jgi:predicted NBD/HSP70 family sugar kinase
MGAKDFVVVAVDIGGTGIRGALVDSLYDLPDRPSLAIATDHSHGGEGVIAQVKHLVDRCRRSQHQLARTGGHVARHGTACLEPAGLA